jgi:MgtC family
LLIRLERGWEQRDKFRNGERIAGFRTFGLVALLGAVAVLIAVDQWLVLAALALGVEIVAASGVADHRRGTERRPSSTRRSCEIRSTSPRRSSLARFSPA